MGKWDIWVDLQGATFSNANSRQSVFEFQKNGQADFIENYDDGELKFTAHHKGTWEKNGCEFQYTGTADGSGTDTTYGPFKLHFDINAPGQVSGTGAELSGSWLSKETYTNEAGAINQTVIGVWNAKKK